MKNLYRLHSLNKTYPKDSYPLPRINQLVDATFKNELLRFTDAFSRYNQSGWQKKMKKIVFIIKRGFYYYKMMSFGLKNAGDTYQYLINKVFKNQIGRNMKVYVDDMLLKSIKVDRQITDLDKALNELRRHQMKLNPSKCTFDVTSKKILDFMVIQRGIETNPEKI